MELVKRPCFPVIHILVEPIEVPPNSMMEYASTSAHPLLMPFGKAFLSGGALRHHLQNRAFDPLSDFPSEIRLSQVCPDDPFIPESDHGSPHSKPYIYQVSCFRPFTSIKLTKQSNEWKHASCDFVRMRHRSREPL
jgi:hypothetical protein